VRRTGFPNMERYVRGVAGTTSRIIAVLGVTALCFSQVAEAQVGLTSGLAQVTLVARRSPEGALPAVGLSRELGRRGSVREAVATVRITANAGYRLVVRHAPGTDARVWVTSMDGELQEVTRDSSVTVDRGRGGDELEREVHIRVDGPGSNTSPGSLPVFYDLVMSPTL
jgi:hypothetical protein